MSLVRVKGVKNPRQSKTLFRFAAIALALSSLGAKCDPLPLVNGPSTTCNTNQVEIAVYDTYVQRLCNCGGTDGEITARGSSLSCTFSLGKTIFIHYIGPGLRHQIVAVGSPGIPDSAIFDPSDRNAIRSHAFAPTATGTYQWKDQYDPALLGDFIVTP